MVGLFIKKDFISGYGFQLEVFKILLILTTLKFREIAENFKN